MHAQSWSRALLLWALVACTEPSSELPGRPAVGATVRARSLEDLRARLSPPEPRGSLAVVWGQAWQGAGYTVAPLSLDAAPQLPVGAALYRPVQPGSDGVIIAHGHFGGGKSTPQVQQLAHRLAGAGLTVLTVDTPGTEEWATDALSLHAGRGAHNRAWLLAGGSSALALELSGLQAGLDLLQEQGVERVVATGASGGAVQSFWLALLDPRVTAVVLAAVPDIPRQPGTGGCGCTALPGLAGPDPTVLAALAVPSLWLSERPGGAPEGLPAHATWRHMEGPHDYSDGMQRAAWAWIGAHLGRDLGSWVDTVPALDLRLPGARALPQHRGIVELALAPTAWWRPEPEPGLAYSLECTGDGPTVIIAGGEPADVRAVVASGQRACLLLLEVDPLTLDATQVVGEVFADRVAGAVLAAVSETQAVSALGVRGWSVAVAGAGVPCRLREPPAAITDLDPIRDPVWMHVPGLWWGLASELWQRCEGTTSAE